MYGLYSETRVTWTCEGNIHQIWTLCYQLFILWNVHVIINVHIKLWWTDRSVITVTQKIYSRSETSSEINKEFISNIPDLNMFLSFLFYSLIKTQTKLQIKKKLFTPVINYCCSIVWVQKEETMDQNSKTCDVLTQRQRCVKSESVSRQLKNDQILCLLSGCVGRSCRSELCSFSFSWGGNTINMSVFVLLSRNTHIFNLHQSYFCKLNTFNFQ